MKLGTAFLIFLPLFLMLLIACDCTSAEQELFKDLMAVSSKTRDMAPSISDEDLTVQVDGNTQFGFDLYSKLKDQPGNLFFSPYSISTALAMTWEGARENTEKQMSDTMHFIKPKPTPHQAFNKIDLSLSEQLANAKSNGDSELKIEIANSIWAQKGEKWMPEFLDSMKVNYGAGIYNVDFGADSEKIRIMINKWVENKTHDKIKDLLPPGVLDAAYMVLVNAVYFYGQWESEFEKKATQDEDFTLLDGSKVVAPLMHQTKDHRYMEDELLKAVEMRYKDCDLSMLVLLPSTEKFAELESKLDSTLIKNVIDKLKYKNVILTFPKVTMESQFGLAETLAGLGMPDAFEQGKADFSGMNGAKDLFISAVIHKAFVAVDEKGTEAAAATGVVMSKGAAPMPLNQVEFKADHPFILIIRDNRTGSILFLGRVLDPR